MKILRYMILLFLFTNIMFIFEIFGYNIFILRQILGFVYLTFIPGLLIFMIFRIDIDDLFSVILYSVGLSLTFVMFIGVILNAFKFVYSKPISKIPLFISINFTIFLLILLMYICYNEHDYNKLNINIPELNYLLLFTIFPFISIFGAYLLNYYNTNLILIILYILLSLIPVLVAMDKIPEKLYPYVIWVVSISLLYSVALSVRNLSGHLSDATLEYYFANLVRMNGFWDSSIDRNKNAMLTIVFVHPIYSLFLNLDLKEVFRIVYPLLYSLTPVALYYTYSKYFNKKISFYSCYWFMVFYVFYVVLSRNTRTGFAELFLSLFLLILTDSTISEVKGRILLLIFAFALVLSHYGVAYMTLFILFTSLFIYYIIFKKYLKGDSNLNLNNRKIINVNLFLVYLVFTLAWYIYTTNSSCFDTLITFFRGIIEEIRRMMVGHETSYGLYAISHKWALSIEISEYLYIISIIFILIGIVGLVFNIIKKHRININIDYVLLSVSTCLILTISLIITKSFNPSRIYHISLCFLSPFVVIGFTKLFKLFKNNKKTMNLVFGIYLMLSLIVGSGVIAETITKSYGDYAPNIILSKPRSLQINDVQYLKSFYCTYLFDREVIATKWLCRVKEKDEKIHMDIGSLGAGLFLDLMGPNDIAKCYVYVKSYSNIKKGYIYLSTLNVERQVALVQLNPPKIINLTHVFPLKSLDKIYTNGGSTIYLKN